MYAKPLFCDYGERARQALSQTDIHPSGADKIWKVWHAPNANGSYHAGITRTLNALGITIPGINSTEDQPGPSISSTRLMLNQNIEEDESK